MTLVEMMVCVFIGTIALAVAMQVWLYTSRGFAAMQNYTDLDKNSQHALDVMSRDIRQATRLNSYVNTPTSKKLEFVDLSGNLFSFEYSSSTRTVTRKAGTQNTVLLRDCDSWDFHISQRNPSNNFSFYATTDASQAKLIDMVWTCSKQIFGTTANTETMQSAKIVLRDH